MECVSTKTNAHGLHGDHLRRSDIAQVDITTDQLDKIQLLRLLRSLPEDLLGRDLGEDLLYQALPYFAAAAVDAHITGLAGFGNNIFGAGIQLGTHQLNPFIRRNYMLRILTAHFTQYRKMLG